MDVFGKSVVAGAITSIAYGIKIQDKDDPYVKLAVEGSKSLIDTAIPGKYLVDSLPFLKHLPDWFPGAGFKREGKKYKVLTDRFREEPFLAAVSALVGILSIHFSHRTPVEPHFFFLDWNVERR